MNKETEKYKCSRCFIEIENEDKNILVLKDVLNGNNIYDFCSSCHSDFMSWKNKYKSYKTQDERKIREDLHHLYKTKTLKI